ncbi:MAG: 16S rRNA (cytosine(1402)-N(4))-methyltransferase RsmH [Acidobacteriota bacterium]|nr:16S rRNA (cytosine(1402)-N(4))-methyltransferase RsmH [Acidobacteriota bacterium]
MPLPLRNWESEPDLGRAWHRPVLVREVVELLRPCLDGVIVDCTVGTGGHAEALLSASDRVRVIGIDWDEEALMWARERLRPYGDRFVPVHDDFKHLAEIMARHGLSMVEGILVDLGISSLQLEMAERGFSFQQEGPLDMRMDRRRRVTAADLVNALGERELADLIFRYGEEPAARRIARAIVRARAHGPIRTTTELAEIVARAVGGRRTTRIHPATRTFQALRIAVNDELSGLEGFVDVAIERLVPGGRLVIISFHSLEDRVIKRRLHFHAGRCDCAVRRWGVQREDEPCPQCGAARRIVLLTRRAIRPSAAEVRENPRARSAKLRAGVRCPPSEGDPEGRASARAASSRARFACGKRV